MSSNASSEGWTAGRVATLAGPAAVAVSALGVFGSVVLASWVLGSWFTWTGNALSHLGDPARATAPLFNWGLVLTGVLGAAFTVRVWAAGTNVWHRIGAATLAVGLLFSSLVGVFDVTEALHTPFALAYFVLLTLGLFAHGSGDAIAGRPRRGVLTTWLAVAHVAGWVGLAFVPFDGIALPELVGVVGLWTWTLTVYASLRG